MVILAAFLATSLALPLPSAPNPGPDESSRSHLLRIWSEVRAMGGRPGENFIQQEFFAGRPEDDDDTNKDLHVVVLIQPELGLDKITVQVTRLERDPRDRNIKTAKETRTIKAEIVKGAVKNLVSDYADLDLHEILEKIQLAVVQKKALLKDRR